MTDDETLESIIDETLERIIACIDRQLCRDLCRFFVKNGWDIYVLGDPLTVEAMVASGYDSGPTVIDLVSLTAFILERGKMTRARPNEHNKITAEQIAACPDLKESYRKILTLSLTEGYEGIRVALELPSIGTVKSRLNRAKLALKAALETTRWQYD